MASTPSRVATRGDVTSERYRRTRSLTDRLAAPLSPEDQTVQSMPDVSPTKWHRAHTSWFFEEFVLGPHAACYDVFDRRYGYLFNSYYETVGARHPRAERGLLTRPGAAEVGAYRRHVDEAMLRFLGSPEAETAAAVAELGIHHEQQHQELLLMDIKHVLSVNPLRPAYGLAGGTVRNAPAAALRWTAHPGGIVETGHRGDGFAFDNEGPRHQVLLRPFQLADRAVTTREWLEFMADGGYERPELWLSDGWAAVQAGRWAAPLYWWREGTDWWLFTLAGPRPVDVAEPVCHVSYYEADAFARWADARLPVEAEWEAVAQDRPVAGRFLDLAALHPAPAPSGDAPGPRQMFGDVWEWTASAYTGYPGFRPAPGAVGEYNGKFMVSQQVLRGGSCVTPPGHVRATYRNFFPPGARWAFSGLRLARDA